MLAAISAMAQDDAYIQRNDIKKVYRQNGNLKQSDYYGTHYIRPQSQPVAVGLKTNGLYDLALFPNIGIELQTPQGIAFQVDAMGAWWNNAAKDRSYSGYGLQAGARYYLGKKKGMKTPYTGHHVGLFGLMATYDFKFGQTGYQSKNLDWTMGVGVSYGYRMPISKRMAVDFTAGLGYLRSKYAVYESSSAGYVTKAFRQLNWWGPTKLEAAIIWELNKDYKRK